MSQFNLEEITSIQNTVEGLEKMQDYFKERLSTALQNEKELRQALHEEIEHSKDLEELWRQEKEKNDCFKELMQICEESDNELQHNDSNDAVSAMSDPKTTFGTISTVLMQYKFDEISLQNKRLVRAYCKKSKELKDANETVHKLKEQHFKLHERIEELCCRYLDFKMRKHDEILELRTVIEELDKRGRDTRPDETMRDAICRDLRRKGFLL